MVCFAHPDDEVVACGGTLLLLSRAGHECVVYNATKGQKGKISNEIREKFLYDTVEQIRLRESAASARILQINHIEYLGFQDGELTNEDVWGGLEEAYREVIDKEKPDFVITFDHTGWYYHLDHIAVSIAVNRAVKHTSTRPKWMLYNFFYPEKLRSRWGYAFPNEKQHSHIVAISSVVKEKYQAAQCHKSQELGFKDELKSGAMNHEFFLVENIAPSKKDVLPCLFVKR